MSLLVLGIGNILLQDEGIGVHVVRELTQRYEMPEAVNVVDGGTSGMDLLDSLASNAQVIIVDAVKTGDSAGTVIRLANEQVRAMFRTKISPHQLGLSDLLAHLKLVNQEPKELVLVGAVPEVMETGLELSDTLSAQVDTMVELVVEEMRRLGKPPVVREIPLSRAAAPVAAAFA